MRGFVFYDGPSLIDGQPIVGIATLKSRNGKTGDMVQTYILRADTAPLEAIASGEDVSICGDCMHRGVDGRKRTCYVDVGKSVSQVYWAWFRGSYPLLALDDPRVVKALSGRRLRMGAYGDPAAIPFEAWRALVALAMGHTGYTHQWRQAWAQALRGLVMASADTAAERDLAHSMGWRTFRVRAEHDPLGEREFNCPASPEGGNRRQCITCLACDGASRSVAQASVAIVVHGLMAKHFA